MSRGQRYKSQGKKGLFDDEYSVKQLSEIGNPLALVSKVVNFEMFRPTYEVQLCQARKNLKSLLKANS